MTECDTEGCDNTATAYVGIEGTPETYERCGPCYTAWYEGLTREDDGEHEYIPLPTHEYVIGFDGFEEHEPHHGARVELEWDRADTDKREEYNVKDVPLTRYERDALRGVIEEYLTKSGVIRGQPEREGWLRAVWWILVDLDVAKSFDELEAPPVANTEAVEAGP